jgi:hypothetical protein
VVRRLFPLFVLAMFLFAVPSAVADPSPTQTAAHEDGLNTESGVGGPDASAAPGATPEESVANQFPPNSVETFRFQIAPGQENSSFDVTVGWPPPGDYAEEGEEVDFDVFVYRIRGNGTLDPNVLTSAASLANPEVASYASPISDDPLRAGQYIVAVHNFCSSEDDPIPASQDDPDTTDNENPCAGYVDRAADLEDRWDAEVTFNAFDPANKLPTVSLSGPTTATTGQSVTYTAAATDPDGSIASVAFDLNGDGVHETNTSGALAASTSFANPGLHSVGVRVIDNEGAPAYASVDVRVTGAPTGGTSNLKPRVLSGFRLNRPVFGGRKSRKLVVSYRLRETGRVIVSLYRGKKRVKRLVSANRRANRTYRINISPRKLRKGATYTVRMFARSADGKRTQSARLSAKRL